MAATSGLVSSRGGRPQECGDLPLRQQYGLYVVAIGSSASHALQSVQTGSNVPRGAGRKSIQDDLFLGRHLSVHFHWHDAVYSVGEFYRLGDYRGGAFRQFTRRSAEFDWVVCGAIARKDGGVEYLLLCDLGGPVFV